MVTPIRSPLCGVSLQRVVWLLACFDLLLSVFSLSSLVAEKVSYGEIEVTSLLDLAFFCGGGIYGMLGVHRAKYKYLVYYAKSLLLRNLWTAVKLGIAIANFNEYTVWMANTYIGSLIWWELENEREVPQIDREYIISEASKYLAIRLQLGLLLTWLAQIYAARLTADLAGLMYEDEVSRQRVSSTA